MNTATALDLRTLLLLAGVFYLLLPLTVWLVLRMPRRTGPLLWCGGGVVGGVGFALMGLRGEIPDEVSYLVGQPVLLLGGLMAAQGLRHDLSRPWPWSVLLGAVMVFAAVLTYLLESAQASTLGVVIRAANLAAVLALVHAGWKVSQAESSRHALTIAVAYGAQALAIGMNLASAWLGSQDIHTMQGSAINHLAYLMMILVALVGSMAYLGLALERSSASTLRLTQEALRSEQGRERRRALAQADRGHILSLLTESISQAMLQPLTAASVNLQLVQRSLQQKPLQSQRPRQWLSQVVTDILNANATIERIRALVRPAPPRREAFELDTVLADLQQLVRVQAIAQRTALHMLQPTTGTVLHGDRMALTHALLQLLQNALAAVSACEKREVRLSVRQAEEATVIQVSDSGPGFSVEVMKSFGSRKELGKASMQGIGLDVVRGIVRQHRGQISLDNAPSGGACVILRLPHPE